jgi:isopenicillin N synthase-like dioxygenase
MHSHDICEMLFSHLDSHLGLPIGRLASMHSTAKQSMTTVRLIHMPPQLQDQQASLFGHTDNGSITILFNVIGGLQILPPGLSNEEQNWRWFRPEPGFAVVNLGDALVQWSGGLLRSNMHRVVNPPGQQSRSDRYSFAYVLKPDNEAPMRRLVGAGVERTQDTNDQCTYDDWLAVKGAASREGRNLIRIMAAS